MSLCGPFFHIWPVAMSQRRWSEVSTPRHNSLSGKNNSLMPQSSYIVWDDSELGEAYCLDVFVVQVHRCGMWGFPPSRVFLDLCVNSRELCIMRCSVGSKGGVCTSVHMCGNLCVYSCDHREDVCVCWEPCRIFLCRKSSPFSCKTRIIRPNALPRQDSSVTLKPSLIETDARPVLHLKFHGVFTLCFRFDSSSLACRVSVENRSGLDTACPLKCCKGASPGHLGVFDLPG